MQGMNNLLVVYKEDHYRNLAYRNKELPPPYLHAVCYEP